MVPTLVEHFEGHEGPGKGRHVVQVSGGNINSGALTNTGRIFTWGCTRHGKSAVIPEVAKGMLSSEGHSVHCGYHTVFMVMRHAVKTGPLDYNLQVEYEEEMEALEARRRKVEQKEQQRLEKIIAPKLGRIKPSSNRSFGGGSSGRFCRKQASSAPVTARIVRGGGRGAAFKSKMVREMTGRLAEIDPTREGQDAMNGRMSQEERLLRPSTSGTQRSGKGERQLLGDSPYMKLDSILSETERSAEEKMHLHRFLKATGATQKLDFDDRWGSLLEAEFGSTENNPYAPTSLSEEELVQIGRATLQFR